MSGYVDDLSEEQERTLRWLQSTLRKKAESPDYASLVPHNYLQEVEDDCARNSALLSVANTAPFFLVSFFLFLCGI